MLVLALETATDLAGVALADEAGVLATATVARGRRHGESIAPAVAFVCARAGVPLQDVDGIAVDVGPGLFTGLRVGLATAKALGFALDRLVVEATSLELLATAVVHAGLGAGAGAGATGEAAGAPLVVPVVDARRGQCFWAPFAPGAGGGVERVGEEGLATPEELAEVLASLTASGRRCLCPGDGALRHGPVLAQVPGVTVPGEPFVHPDPSVLAALGVQRHLAGAGVAAEAVAARYLREADVRINWEQRLAPRPVGG